MHRDLKPENILVSDYNLDSNSKKVYIMLTDFGFATQSGREGSNLNCGTPEWKAPEILRGEDYDNKVDIWAAGCIFYWLFAGSPFGAEDADNLTTEECE